MKRIINVDTIIQNLPVSFNLPSNFDAFVNFVSVNSPDIHVFFDISWTNPEDFELVREAVLELVPFLRFGDGGIAAFWLNTASSTPIIHINTEGGYSVSASSFDEFIERIELHMTGIPDIDEPEGTIVFHISRKDRAELAKLNSLNTKFKRWYKKHSALQQPIQSGQTEAIRKNLYAIAYDMIKDGLSKVHTLDSTYWSINYKILSKKEIKEILYLDYGNWIPVPSKYRVLEEALKLLPFTKSKNLEMFELVVVCNGIVSVNRDRELVLISPK